MNRSLRSLRRFWRNLTGRPARAKAPVPETGQLGTWENEGGQPARARPPSPLQSRLAHRAPLMHALSQSHVGSRR